VSHQDTLGHQTTLLVRGLFWTNARSVWPCSNLKRYVCEVSALYRCQVHSHAMCASVHCTISIPDLAVQGFADGDCSGDVIIPRPGHHNLCVALTCVAVLHLHRQTCSAMRVMCVSMSRQTAGLTWCCISPAQTDSHLHGCFLVLAAVLCSNGSQLLKILRRHQSCPCLTAVSVL
jgi:hypothetical protein